MRYVLFSLTALFLTACADTDNPVVSTAPAGKTLQLQPPGTNQASSRKLVGNSARQRNTAEGLEQDHRQDFTTGPTHYDWKLTAVKLSMEVYTDKAEEVIFTVEIWTTGSDGRLITRLGTLTRPSSMPRNTNAALYTFTGNIDLEANTTYALVVDAVGRADRAEENIHLDSTNSGAEDSGSAAGWSIANNLYEKYNDETAWRQRSRVLRIEIHGYENKNILTSSEVDRHQVSALPSPNNGCTVTYYVDENGDRVNELVPGGKELTRREDCWWKEAWDTGSPTLRESIENLHRYEELREDNVLPVISVSGCKDGSSNAVFTFSRNGPTTEHLSFTFRVSGGPNSGKSITTGFGAGHASFEWNGGEFSDGNVKVTIEDGWLSEMTGDFILGTSSAIVNSSSSTCPN